MSEKEKDGRPPHGKPPHGKPPHGKPPHGEPPHGERHNIEPTSPKSDEDSISDATTRFKAPEGGGVGGGQPNGRGGGPGARFTREKVKPKNSKETLLRLWAYLGHHKMLLIIALVFVVINSILSILASYMIRPIVNGLIDKSGVDFLIKNLVIMFIVYFVAVVSQYIQTRIMLEIAQKSLARLRSDLFTAMQKLPLKFFDNTSNGELMSKFTNDVDAVNQMLSSTCVTLVSGVFTLVTTVAIMFYTNWLLTIVTLTVTPIFAMITKRISKKSMGFFKGQQQSIGLLNGFIEERITGQKVIKVFNHEDETIEEFRELNKNYRDKSFNAQFLSGTMGPIMGSLAQVGYIITATIGGLLCVAGKFDIGGYTVFLNYSKSFSRPVNEIFMQVNTVFSALAGAERVFDVMNQNPEPEDLENATELKSINGEVTFEDVCFGYKENVPVLRSVSLTAKANQKIAFVGSTGAGKTTITNLLNRFYDIQSGSIKIDGIDITTIKREVLRENIAMVLQDTHLFTGTIMDNIKYGRLDATDEDVILACKTANADKFIRKLEHGYNTILTGDGSNLSAGQRQLLNIARAAISKAPILVLDEATSSVDTRTERQIQEALDRLMQSRTTFVIAHRLSTVRNSDEIIVLELGEIIEQGTHEELLELEGKYHSLYTGTSKLE